MEDDETFVHVALEKYNAQLADARAEAAEIREQARERGKQIEDQKMS